MLAGDVVRAFITAAALCGSNPAHHLRFGRLHLRAILILSSLGRPPGEYELYLHPMPMPLPTPQRAR